MSNEHVNIKIGESRTMPKITSLWLYRIHDSINDNVNYFVTSDKTLAFRNDNYATEFAEKLGPTETDDIAFADEMKKKMAMKRDEGAFGWASKSLCSDEALMSQFRLQVQKGNVVNAANYLMMLHHRGARLNPVVPL